jgi:ABC-type Fe3+/spermidine/putrescine transport system ATPase subunit
LLDEPLSALDKKLREEMKYWIKDLQQKLRITTVYVTHDQNEALTMSDRIAVMNKGVVEQVGTPQEIYERPVSRFVTDFIGESNILAGEVVGLVDGAVELAFLNQRVVARRTRDVRVGDKVHFVVRPENVRLGTTANGHGMNVVRGIVRSTSYQGALIRHEVSVGNEIIIAESQNTPGATGGEVAEEVTIGWPVESTALLVD